LNAQKHIILSTLNSIIGQFCLILKLTIDKIGSAESKLAMIRSEQKERDGESALTSSKENKLLSSTTLQV